MPNFMKILPLGAELFHADRRTDRHKEANSRFSQFCESTQKVSPPPQRLTSSVLECLENHVMIFPQSVSPKTKQLKSQDVTSGL